MPKSRSGLHRETGTGDVAQMARAAVSKTAGRRFKSCQPRYPYSQEIWLLIENFIVNVKTKRRRICRIAKSGGAISPRSKTIPGPARRYS